MNSTALLTHYDTARLWPGPTGFDMTTAYNEALKVRNMRIARGEQPKGYKIGFTNQGIWPRYNATAPIWGTTLAAP